MPTTFDEVLLDDAYSAVAEGGPEHATALDASGAGGSILSRAETREDFVSKYDILYGDLENTRRQALRSFSILRKGMARGFRFLAPDHHELVDEYVGWLVDGELLQLVSSDETFSTVFVIKTYQDNLTSYVRRITKPSPFADIVIKHYSGAVLQETYTIEADSCVDEDGNITDAVFLFAGRTAAFSFEDGRMTFSSPLGTGQTFKISCEYHLPVCFSEDWTKFKVDEAGISEFRIGVTEILPAEIGIADEEGEAPDMLPYDPLDHPAIWSSVRADSYTTYANNAFITPGDSWVDRTGNNRHWNPTGNKVKFKEALFNGKDAIALEGGSTSFFTGPSMTGLTQAYIRIILRQDDLTVAQPGFAFGPTGDYYPYGEGNSAIYMCWGSNAGWVLFGGTPAVTLTNLHIAHGFSGPGDWSFSQNNSLIHSTATNTVAFISAPKVGHNSSEMTIVGIDIFSAKPTTAQIAGMNAFDGDEFAIPGL